MVRWCLAIATLALAALTACSAPSAAQFHPGAQASDIGTGTPTVTPSPSPPGPPLNLHAKVTVPATDAWWSWAAMNTATGEMAGSANWDVPNHPMSMMKAWIASDYLEHTYPAGKEPATEVLAELGTMIQDSANEPARKYWDLMGGYQTTGRMKSKCAVTDLVVRPNAWTLTDLSARDAVRIGACIADGRAAGRWTGWVLDKMRHVRGDGDFGPRRLFADPTTVATKNGWSQYTGRYDPTGSYYVNCLAIGDGWVMAIEFRRPGASWAVTEADQLCQAVGRSLLRPDLILPPAA